MIKKKNVLITGSSGFIGSNLKVYLENSFNDLNITSIKHSSSEKLLLRKLKDINFIFHLAGVNRSKSLKEFSDNFLFLDKICNILKNNKLTIPIVFASTILIDKKNEVKSKMHERYIQSKIKAENVLKKYNSYTRNKVYIYRLPHIMGKWAKPNYNSVIATFCHNIANDKKVIIQNENDKLLIVQIDDVVESFIEKIYKNEKGGVSKIYLKNKSITVLQLYKKIYKFNNFLKDNYTPSLKSKFDRNLYSTFISYLPSKKLTFPLKNNKDQRGNFVECFKSLDFGQISFFTSNSKISRGGHFHHLKCEIFIVIQGKALYQSKKIIGGNKKEFILSDKNLKIIRTIPGEIHSIKNIDKKKLIVMLWSNEIFSKNKPDTFFIK